LIVPTLCPDRPGHPVRAGLFQGHRSGFAAACRTSCRSWGWFAANFRFDHIQCVETQRSAVFSRMEPEIVVRDRNDLLKAPCSRPPPLLGHRGEADLEERHAARYPGNAELFHGAARNSFLSIAPPREAHGHRFHCQNECRVNKLPLSAIKPAQRAGLKVYQSQPVALCLQRLQANPTHHSTVTDFAKFLGLSTSVPRASAV
jgi:hypothetical protein